MIKLRSNENESLVAADKVFKKNGYNGEDFGNVYEMVCGSRLWCGVETWGQESWTESYIIQDGLFVRNIRDSEICSTQCEAGKG
jgi:hypothetical protein